MSTAIRVEDLSKYYRLGLIGGGTLREDVSRWWAKVRRKPDPLLTIGQEQENVEGEYIWALRDINFEVEQGEVLGIVGRNGAGKSTLLKILSCITAPTSGEIKIKGRTGSLLEVGTGFHPELTGRENVYLNGAVLGMSKQEVDRKFDEIVNFSGVEKYIDTPVKRYSSGMRVRLAFAVAAHLEPEVLIIDEVLAVGDVAFQKKCVGKMSKVASGGRTILFVSHNMASVSSLCNRCIYLDQGRIREEGDSREVILRYLEDSREDIEQPLAERTDREGNGWVRLTSIRFFDSTTNRPIDTVMSGQDVYIEVAYQAQDVSIGSLSRLNIGLAFFTKEGQFVMVLNSEMANRAFEKLPPAGTVYCHISRFPLMTGLFSVTATMRINKYLVDQVHNAVELRVENGDFFGTGISNAYGRQGVYVSHRWLQDLD